MNVHVHVQVILNLNICLFSALIFVPIHINQRILERNSTSLSGLCLTECEVVLMDVTQYLDHIKSSHRNKNNKKEWQRWSVTFECREILQLIYWNGMKSIKEIIKVLETCQRVVVSISKVSLSLWNRVWVIN